MTALPKLNYLYIIKILRPTSFSGVRNRERSLRTHHNNYYRVSLQESHCYVVSIHVGMSFTLLWHCNNMYRSGFKTTCLRAIWCPKYNSLRFQTKQLSPWHRSLQSLCMPQWSPSQHQKVSPVDYANTAHIWLYFDITSLIKQVTWNCVDRPSDRRDVMHARTYSTALFMH